MKNKLKRFLNNIQPIALFVVVLFVAISCDNGNFNNTKALAEYNNKVLYWSDLESTFPEGLEKQDSIQLLRKMVDEWIVTQLLVERASQNLDIEKIDIERRVEKYRNDLFIHQYKRQLLKEKLDTTVTNEQIQEYYSKHADEFRLRDNILSYYFIKVPISVPDAYNVSSWLYNVSNEDILNRLKEYSYQKMPDIMILMEPGQISPEWKN